MSEVNNGNGNVEGMGGEAVGIVCGGDDVVVKWDGKVIYLVACDWCGALCVVVIVFSVVISLYKLLYIT